jgi:hypothetical protein
MKIYKLSPFFRREEIRRKNPQYFLSAILINLTIAAAIVSISIISCNPPESKEPVAAAAAAKPKVPLIPEDKLRLSNDPQKTELFRDAGLGRLKVGSDHDKLFVINKLN